MEPAHAARAIARAAAGNRPVVVLDRPHLRLAFNLMGGPRRIRLMIIHDAFKKMLKARRTPAAGADG